LHHHKSDIREIKPLLLLFNYSEFKSQKFSYLTRNNIKQIIQTYLLVIILTLFSVSAYAAPDCKNQEALIKEDSKLISDLQKQLVARKTEIKKYKDQLKNSIALIEKYQKLDKQHLTLTEKYNHSLEGSVNLNTKYKANSTKLLGLTEKYGKLVNDYDDLVGKYRDIALSSSSFITFDLAAGATTNNGSTEAAALIGLGIKQFRLYGFLQDNNNGVMAGASFSF